MLFQYLTRALAARTFILQNFGPPKSTKWKMSEDEKEFEELSKFY